MSVSHPHESERRAKNGALLDLQFRAANWTSKLTPRKI
jgi:hypothetical protein